MTDPLSAKPPKGLWLTAIAMALFIITLVVGNFFLAESRRLSSGMVGHDFLAFYTAGTFVREGRSHELYDLEKFKVFQHELAKREGLEIGPSYGPFWNPPFYAWTFVPLSAMPYHHALAVWAGFNALCLAAALLIVVHLLRSAGFGAGIWALAPLTVMISMPFIQASTHGQNTPTSLLLLCLTLLFWTEKRPLLAGLFAGMLLYKPQLGALIAAALIVTSGWRALAGVALTASFFALITLFTLPGAVGDYQRLLPHNLHVFQVDQPYLWDRHVTLRAFWRLLIQGKATGEMLPITRTLWIISCMAIVGMLARGAWAIRGCTDRCLREAWLAAVIVAMPLLMPFYFDYDLLLMATAVLLTLRARPEETRFLLAAWVTLFFWLLVNSTVARLTQINGTVLILCVILFRTSRLLRPQGQCADAAVTAPPLAINGAS